MPLIDPLLLIQQPAFPRGRFDVDALDQCDSTSSELLRRAAQGVPSGSVLVADQQSGGRGRRGRVWLSAPEASLTFSLLWRFPAGTTALSGLSLAIGVAIAEGLADLGASGVCLKWPNDVLLRTPQGYAKLAGVLIELASDRRGFQAVIGIGLNLDIPAAHLPALGQPVGALSAVLQPVPDRHAVLAHILAALARILDRFTVDGFVGLKSAWLAHHAWQDQPVKLIEEGAVPVQGLCRGVDDEGALLLETDQGLTRILAGDVSLFRT